MLPNIRRNYENGNIREYVIDVHALKGISLTIGAKSLSEAAKELEYAGKADNIAPINSKTPALLELYGKVLAQGEKYLAKQAVPEDNGSDKAVEEISFEELSAYVEKILEAYQSFDSSEVSTLCDDLGKYYCRGVTLKQVFGDVKAAAEDFECEQAAEKAKAAFDKIRG